MTILTPAKGKQEEEQDIAHLDEYLFVDLPKHPPRQTLLLCINQAKAVGPMAYSVVVDQM